MSDLDPKTKLKAARAKVNGKQVDLSDAYVNVPVKVLSPNPRTTVLYSRDAISAVTQFSVTLTIRHQPRIKKGCGQRKNKRDRAGRARHVQLLPYGHQPTVSLAS